MEATNIYGSQLGENRTVMASLRRSRNEPIIVRGVVVNLRNKPSTVFSKIRELLTNVPLVSLLGSVCYLLESFLPSES